MSNGREWFEDDESGTWSNELNPQPITADAIRKAIEDLRELASKPMPEPVFGPLPAKVHERFVEYGWIDERGHLTDEYWRVVYGAK